MPPPVQYVSGSVERPWLAEPAHGRICKLAGQQLAEVDLWLEAAHQSVGNSSLHWRDDSPSAAVLSRYTGGCDARGVEFIEPLHGYARHPLAALGCVAHRAGTTSRNVFVGRKFNIDHLILLNRCEARVDASASARARHPYPCARGHRHPRGRVAALEHRAAARGSFGGASPPHSSSPPRAELDEERLAAGRVARLDTATAPGGERREAPREARALFFDLGCSVYSGKVRLDAGSGDGPSLPLFYQLYERNCIAFDRLYGWEAAPHDPARWWRDVPAWMRAKLTFFNEPVQAENFLAFLRAHAHVDDVVVLKVDIDSP